MTTIDTPVVQRATSPAVARFHASLLPRTEAAVRRRLGYVWAFLFLNVLTYNTRSVLIPMPHSVGRLLTQGALTVALLVALSVNRKLAIRPNLFLFLLTVLALLTMAVSIKAYFGPGTVFRAARFVEFVGVLWLLTPWWGRDDLLFVRFLRRALIAILATVVAGMVLFPGKSLGAGVGHRLTGVIWPIPATQVAEYAAILGGVTAILWFTHLLAARTASLLLLGCVALIVLSHTRTALIGMCLGILVAALSLFLSRRRVRKALGVTVLLGAIIAVSFAPFLSSWFVRGESGNELATFTGRTKTWTLVTAQPRTELHTLFGYGLSNDSMGGLPIDSSWYSSYLDQGLVGDVIDGGTLLLLLVLAALSPRGPRRALALFLVVYCAISSVTETGLGQATPYLLYLSVVASVLMPPLQLPPSSRRTGSETGSSAPPPELGPAPAGQRPVGA